MRSLILLGGSDIDHDQRFAGPESSDKLITTDRFEAFTRTQIRLDQALYARQSFSR
jgi:hypothetical protein